MKFFVKGVFFLVGLVTISLLVITFLYGHKDIPLDQLKRKYANENSQFMDLMEMQVHYRDEGVKTDSVPIVLIHGTGASLHTFNDWTSELSKKRRVIRMDLPAYGLTGPFPDRDYNMTQYVKFLEGFVDKLALKKFIVAGNSLGGLIAWRYTAKNPEKVEKLILIDAAGYPIKSKSTPIAFRAAKIPLIKNIFKYITPRFIAKSSVQNVYFDKSLVSEELVDRYFELTLRPGNRQAFVDRFEASYDTASTALIKGISTPTLVLWGAEDNLIPLYMADLFHQDLPNDTLVILDNAGHVPMEEIPERSLNTLLAFLDDY